MKRVSQAIVMVLVLAAFNIAWSEVEERADCTLEPAEGSKRVQLANGITADMSWSACTSIVTEIVFSPVSQDLLSEPNVSLKRAAQLIAELESKTQESVCPFDGSISEAFKKRANAHPYEFGEDVRISNTDMPGWDGASVMLRQQEESVVLAVRYWANP